MKVNKIKDIRYDNKAHCYYKIYEQDFEILPICMIMKKRDADHYLNMNIRCNQLIHSFKPKRQVLCMNMHLFGVLGRVSATDVQRYHVKVAFDKVSEEAKIHDPFFGQRVLSDQDLHKQLSSKLYYSDYQIE